MISAGTRLGSVWLPPLLEAVQNKEVDPDDAYLHAQDKKPFQRFVTDRRLLPQVALVGR